MTQVYSKEILLKSLSTGEKLPSIWAAYSLLSMFPNAYKEYIPIFLDSPFLDIQEAGIAKIGETKLEKYGPILLHIFKNETGRLKQSSALALSKFPNDLFHSLLKKWFDSLLQQGSSTHIELVNCTKALLNTDPKKNIPLILEKIQLFKQDLIKSSILFKELLPDVEEETIFLKLIDEYFELRNTHSDIHFSQRLLKLVGHYDLMLLLYNKIDEGMSLTFLYQQSSILLEWYPSLKERNLWEKLEQYYIKHIDEDTIQKMSSFVSTLYEWSCEIIKREEVTSEHNKLIWIIRGFYKNYSSLHPSIPKLAEIEMILLSSIPLILYLNIALNRWLKEPILNVNQIADYYYSPLVSEESREKVLNVFFSKLPKWEEEEMKITDTTSFVPKEALHITIWSLLQGKLLGKNVLWPTIFPNPEITKHLSKALCNIYIVNFDWYILQKDTVSINYALKLFQIVPKKESIQILQKHFDYLYQYHTDGLYETIEYLPHPSFINKLTKKYHPEETELIQLIKFICLVFDKPFPSEIDTSITQEKKQKNTIHKIRLYCSNCKHTYKYAIKKIYVNEDALSEFKPLELNSIWIEESLFCKNCKDAMSFNLTKEQLENIAFESKMNRILKNSSIISISKNIFKARLQLISFPKIDDTSYNPDELSRLIVKYESTPEKWNNLYLIQLRFYITIEIWEKVIEISDKMIHLNINSIAVYVYRGIAFYKLQQPLEAREALTSSIAFSKEHKKEKSEKILIDEAKKYLELLNNKENKKLLFKVIEGEK